MTGTKHLDQKPMQLTVLDDPWGCPAFFQVCFECELDDCVLPEGAYMQSSKHLPEYAKLGCILAERKLEDAQ